jgi:YjbE family integral membrane protein
VIDFGQITALVQVVLIDITLAGDNAIVVGLAAAGLAPQQRGRAIFAGIAIATVLRVCLALIASRLLAIIGLTLAGGILLLWVAWKMFREIMSKRSVEAASEAGEGKPKTIGQAMLQIVLADVSMSVDNVLAVAGTAREHMLVLVAGLTLSVALMGVASSLITSLLNRLPWLVWIGLSIITYVALNMIYDGWHQVSVRL